MVTSICIKGVWPALASIKVAPTQFHWRRDSVLGYMRAYEGIVHTSLVITLPKKTKIPHPAEEILRISRFEEIRT